jgi:hypothetical protein
MRVVGVSGKMRHGKDTVVAQLCHVWGFHPLSFAGALKEEVLARMPRTLAFFHNLSCDCAGFQSCLRDMVYNRKPPGVRALLQEYGSDVRRGDDPNYWCKRWLEEAEHWDSVACPDVRFPNEAQTVRGAGGRLWRVVRPSLLPAGDGEHVSERALDSWDFDEVITNDGTVEDLQKKVDALMGRGEP